MVKSRQFIRSYNMGGSLPQKPHHTEINMIDTMETKLETKDTHTHPFPAPRIQSSASRSPSMNGVEVEAPQSSENNNHTSTTQERDSNRATPVTPSAVAQQALPPSCGAKELSKLKRFLTTLQQFGTDISAEIGDKVRALVLALLNSQISIEQFHRSLHETTNFPLKPFVIPFLKATLPALQMELQHCAQLSKMTPQQYLSRHEKNLFEGMNAPGSHSPISLSDIKPGSPVPEDRKRRNTSELSDSAGPLNKKRNSSNSPPSTRVSTSSPNDLFGFSHIQLDDISRRSANRLEAVDLSFINKRKPLLVSPEKLTEDYQNLDTMLNCVVNMVGKSRQSLNTMREQQLTQHREILSWLEKQPEHNKQFTNEMVSQTLKQSEDRVAEVKLRAEEVINQVKRQAITELHKAVTAAEMRANELITQEKMRMERTLRQLQKAAREEAFEQTNMQSDAEENCWNCGRKANETCSGCNHARYCGKFCQHRDWDKHHKNCGSQSKMNRENSNQSATAMAERQSNSATPPHNKEPISI